MNKQEILKEQFIENQDTARLVWRIYRREMTRLIENPDARPDVSALERFIENESGTFGQTLAQLFIDAIEYGDAYAWFLTDVCCGEEVG